MPSFKEELLLALKDEFEVTPRTVAEGMAHVIRGESVTETFNGNGELTKRQVSRSPKDVLNGTMIYDALRGGDLGIAPRQLRGVSGTAAAPTIHRRLEVDSRIIANGDEETLVQSTLELVVDDEA